MDAQWIKSPAGRRVLEHWADARPSWLWLSDGQTLLWRNTAARAVHGKPKGRSRASAGDAIPIRGQIPRLIRLGSLNRPSLARLQFLTGDRPTSATCACTPLSLPDGQVGLLIVDVDPIDADVLPKPQAGDGGLEAILPAGTEYLLLGETRRVLAGTSHALAAFAPAVVNDGVPPVDAEGRGALLVGERPVGFSRFKAGPQADPVLLLFFAGDEAVAMPEPAPLPEPVAEEHAVLEPLLPMGLPPAEPTAPSVDAPVASADEYWLEPLSEPARVAGGLSSLFDRLLDDSELFAPLRPDEEFAPLAPAPAEAVAPVEPTPEVLESAAVDAAPAEDAPADTVAHADSSPAAEPAPEPDEPAPETAVVVPQGDPTADEAPTPLAAAAVAASSRAPTLFRLIGRGFTPVAVAEEPFATPPSVAAPAAPTAPATHENLDGLLSALGIEPDASTAPTVEPIAAAETPPDASVAPEPTPPPGEKDETESVLEAAALAGEEPQVPGDQPEQDQSAEPEAARNIDSAPSSAEAVERVSRYNFDELSRILTDRVGGGERVGGEAGERNVALGGRPGAPALPSATPEGALVTLGGETLVLNRLPLGILVFRDQQVLFANRAITEMIGYESVESLRRAGLASIFAASADDRQGAGPVNHLVQRDGTLVPVTARLQSVSWQGKPALMLSASTTEVRTGHEAAVRAFAELLADTRSDGFIETNRTGVITRASAEAQLVLGMTAERLVGRPISQLIAPDDLAALKTFLERPARFAETSRPAATFRATVAETELLLFAQGQAGTIMGYFGFARRLAAPLSQMLAAPHPDGDPALLERLSRGVRRPLNTVIGFSDLIGSTAFGPIENQRYVEYARDIKTAGLEIAALVDELDDFARLRDGRYTTRPSDLDLAALLESSVMRVRGQANQARVLVRSAISERLPRVRADRASLAQAVLNILASAIDQTPQDGSVVLSAQVDDLGGVTIHVRDSAAHPTDISERFVVFRDGRGRDGEMLTPVPSSVGLALTRALLAVNAAALAIEPTAGTGTLFSLTLAPENVVIASPLPADKK